MGEMLPTMPDWGWLGQIGAGWGRLGLVGADWGWLGQIGAGAGRQMPAADSWMKKVAFFFGVLLHSIK